MYDFVTNCMLIPEHQLVVFRKTTATTTLAMKKSFQKHQILESLNDLDQAQTEDVLKYIKGIVNRTREESRYELFSKRQAMMQIRQALKQTRNLQGQ